MKPGTAARVKAAAPIEGVVVEKRISPHDGDTVELKLRWAEADGDVVERWFDADQLETAE